MKDLYRRNRLEACEADPVKIHNCEGGSDAEKDAAYTILLNENKKIEYDRVYKAVQTIGYIRGHFGLSKSSNWHRQYSDFVRSDKEAIISTKDNTENTSQQKTDDEPVEKSRSSMPLIYTALAAVLVLFFVYSSVNNEKEVGGISEKVLMHANSDIKVTIKTDPNSQVLKGFGKYDDVQMYIEDSKSNWVRLDLGGYEGFVPRAQLNEGSGEEAYIKSCAALGVPSRPKNGMQFIPYSKGEYVLVVVNPPGADAIVKLKNGREKEIGLFYIRGGSTVTLEDFPDEPFRIFYAHGTEYSASCERFLSKMNVMREKDFQALGRGGNAQFSRTYTLRGGSDYQKVVWKMF